MTPAEFIDNPNWADFLPEWREPSRRRALPAHEDCSPLSEEAVAAHLAAGGMLAQRPGYEERPGQLAMLRAVVRAFNAREHLMVEVGTGVGKSLAYLLPAVHWAQLNDTAVVVSTATRNLQSQLVSSDIPQVLQTLGADAAKFKCALLKGRTNYLCLRMLSEFFAAGFWTMAEDEQAEMPHFIEWFTHTEDGDLDAYEGLPRSLLSCPGEECGGRRCRYYTRCFIQRARRCAAEANLVVVNHALVLAEAASEGGALLPPYGRLVLDEAHNLEAIATEYFSREFSMAALARILNRLVRQRRSRHGQASGGVLAGIERQLQKGVLAGSECAEAVRRRLAAVPGAVVRLVNAADELSEAAARMLRPAKDRDCVRYRVADGVRMHSLHGLFAPYGRDWDEAGFAAARGRFESESAALVNLLHDLRDTLEGSAAPGELNYCADIASQVALVAESLVAFSNDAAFVFDGGRETHAYWVERVRDEKRRLHVRCVASPLSVAEDLAKRLYDGKDSVVMSSATLRVGNDFRYMAKRLGCRMWDGSDEARFRALVAESPFDYLRQALVLAPDCLPDPASDFAGYTGTMSTLLRDLCAITRGRALVLFTSYEMMNAVAAAARPLFADAGLTLFVQGEGMSRETMTERLKGANGERVVLFGSQSFWEGVDVAGSALSCVVIARLPFAQLGDPIVEARAERIQRAGGSAFRDYSLPEAVIRFRQGFGRLIRTRRDRGVVVVTDPRLVTRNYGSSFRKSLPTSVHTVTEIGELLHAVAEFMTDGEERTMR